jgi:hypothetical protein
MCVIDGGDAGRDFSVREMCGCGQQNGRDQALHDQLVLDLHPRGFTTTSCDGESCRNTAGAGRHPRRLLLHGLS